MDEYQTLLDIWLECLPGFARYEAYMRSFPDPTYTLTNHDVDRAVMSNLLSVDTREDVERYGVRGIPIYNQSIFDAAEVIKFRMQSQPISYTR